MIAPLQMQSFDTESLLTLSEGTHLQIHNCTFTHISTLRDGAILTAGYRENSDKHN